MIPQGKFTAKKGKVYNELEVMFIPAKNYAAITSSQEGEDTAKLFAVANDLARELQEAHRFLRKNGYNMTKIDKALKKAGL